MALQRAGPARAGPPARVRERRRRDYLRRRRMKPAPTRPTIPELRRIMTPGSGVTRFGTVATFTLTVPLFEPVQFDPAPPVPPPTTWLLQYRSLAGPPAWVPANG